MSEEAVKQRLSRARARPVRTGLMLGKAAGGKLGAKMGGATALTAGALGGAVFGLLGGWLAVIGGARALLKLARDGEERRGVLRMSTVCLLATLGVCHFVWLPRIMRRRYQAEMDEDPEWATREHRARRQKAVAGFVTGLAIGSLPIVAAWFWLS